MRFIETHALFTRTGPQGIRKGQRARPRRDRVHPSGQPSWRPDLDTHVAVANEVQSLDGQLVGLARLGEQDDGKASLGLT